MRMPDPHWVVIPTATVTQATLEEKAVWTSRAPTSKFYQAEAHLVGKIARVNDAVLLQEAREIVVPVKLPLGSSVIAGQAAFYAASAKIQQQFENLFGGLLPFQREQGILVTVVDTAISARAAVMGKTPAFEVVAAFQQFLWVRPETPGYTLFSTNGAYPVQVMTDAEIASLLQVER